MKGVIVFLAMAVALANGAPHLNLKPILTEVQCLHKKALETEEFDKVYVKDLKMNETDICAADLFCQADIVLSQVKLPSDTGPCSFDKLHRNLKLFNKGVTCSVPKNGDEIILRWFLDDLMKCAKKVFSKPAQMTRSLTHMSPVTKIKKDVDNENKFLGHFTPNC